MFKSLLTKFFPSKAVPKTAAPATVEKPAASEWGAREAFNPSLRQARDAFCIQLITGQPRAPVAAFARRSAALAETRNTVEHALCGALSLGAETLLKALDRVHRQNPLLAVRVAAIVCVHSHYQYQLTQQLADRLCRWIGEEGRRAYPLFDLGVTLYENWPDRLSSRLRDRLAPALLQWIARESATNAEAAYRSVLEKYPKFSNSFGHIFGWNDDKAALLRIAAAFKAIDPAFTKSVLLACLSSGRYAEGPEKPDDDHLRAIANELFDMVADAPALSPDEAGYFYIRFGAAGFPDAPWYPVILQRLFDAAVAIGDAEKSAVWSRAVAINADAGSALSGQALARFRNLVEASADAGKIELAKVLVETANIGIADKRVYLGGWNVSVPSNPAHPILAVASRAYWRIVETLTARPSADVLSVLVTAIEGKDDAMAEAAAARMRAEFETMAKADATVAGYALGRLIRIPKFSGTGRALSERCRSLCDELMPVLAAISPKAVDLAREAGRDPREDM